MPAGRLHPDLRRRALPGILARPITPARRLNKDCRANCHLAAMNLDRAHALLQADAERRSSTMCDYSLMHVKSRPASVGDKLRTSNFGTGTRGFAAPDDPDTAVCVLPGTELAFEAGICVYGASGPSPHKTAIF